MNLTSSKPFIKPHWYPTVEIENQLLMDHRWSLLIPCLPPLLFRRRSICCITTTGLLAPPSTCLRHRQSACTTAGFLASPPSWPRVFWGSDLWIERRMYNGGEVEMWLVAADRKVAMASDGWFAGRWEHKGAMEVKWLVTMKSKAVATMSTATTTRWSVCWTMAMEKDNGGVAVEVMGAQGWGMDGGCGVLSMGTHSLGLHLTTFFRCV